MCLLNCNSPSTCSKELTLRVECYAGYRGEEEPRAFLLGERRIVVAELLDRWLAPDYRYFKVKGNDDAMYILRHDTAGTRWELTLFVRGPKRE